MHFVFRSYLICILNITIGNTELIEVFSITCYFFGGIIVLFWKVTYLCMSVLTRILTQTIPQGLS